MYGHALATQRQDKQNPQAWGPLGGSCLELRPLRAHWSVGGRGRAGDTLKISGAALQTTIALWCNGIAPWYAAGVEGQYVSVRQHFDH
jgi:hypothetical protein